MHLLTITLYLPSLSPTVRLIIHLSSYGGGGEDWRHVVVRWRGVGAIHT